MKSGHGTTDVTANQEASQSPKHEAYESFFDVMPHLAFITDDAGATVSVNRRWFDVIGGDPTRPVDWTAPLHPNDRGQTIGAWQHALATGADFKAEHRLLGWDGGYRWFLTRAVARRAETGQIWRWFGTATEVSTLVWAREQSELRVAELHARVAERTAALTAAATELQAEMQRRQILQSTLLQSQKLEALGQLTAGVAHDFNNMLTAILGSFELITQGDATKRVIDLAGRGRAAGLRAAALVRQLLAFGRRDAMRPAVLDIATVLGNADGLLDHAMGSAVARVVDIQADLWPVLADPHQLEIALINLAINARDAMPDGGTLTLIARNLTPEERPATMVPRDYVAISVQDTGAGMPPDILARAREPFFTTKPPGQGTGLGLTTVQGFAAQSDGCIEIDSSPNGTRVQIILPRAGISVPDEETAPPSDGPAPATILLVEDDAQVRHVASTFLRSRGFVIVEAASAEAALVLVHAMESVDLLITDIAMPGAQGPALAERLRQDRAGLPVLFITGDTGLQPQAGQTVLRKPFSGAALEDAVRIRLAQRPDVTVTPETRLLRKLRNPLLAATYLAWRAARAGTPLPRLADLEKSLLPAADNAFTVEVDEESGSFRYLHFGPALAMRLGHALSTVPIPDDDEILGQLDGAYRNCARTLAPTYQYARYDFGDGAPILFERLLLPLSEDGKRVSHLIGIVIFVEMSKEQQA